MKDFKSISDKLKTLSNLTGITKFDSSKLIEPSDLYINTFNPSDYFKTMDFDPAEIAPLGEAFGEITKRQDEQIIKQNEIIENQNQQIIELQNLGMLKDKEIEELKTINNKKDAEFIELKNNDKKENKKWWFTTGIAIIGLIIAIVGLFI